MTSSDNVIHDDMPVGDPPSADEADSSDVPFGETETPLLVVPRAMIAVERLAAHPGNVRRDLDLSPEFVESIAVNGVLVALRITPDGDSFRVIDGGRRLAAALKAGVTEVPYDLVSDRAGDEAGQYLDMINMNRHRNRLTPLEEADALFAARESGATKTRLRKAAGLTSATVNGALVAARLSDETRAIVEGLDEQLSLDELAVLAEFFLMWTLCRVSTTESDDWLWSDDRVRVELERVAGVITSVTVAGAASEAGGTGRAGEPVLAASA